jgi:hypothetical protein
MLRICCDANAMSHPYDALTPDAVVDCVEAVGYRCDLRLIGLNSYENRGSGHREVLSRPALVR